MIRCRIFHNIRARIRILMKQTRDIGWGFRSSRHGGRYLKVTVLGGGGACVFCFGFGFVIDSVVCQGGKYGFA